MSTAELNAFKREFIVPVIQEITNVKLSKKFTSILKYISEEQQNLENITFKKIGRDLSISHSTVTKRITYLKNKGLIHIEKNGREKKVLLTKKAINLLKKS